MDLASAQFTEQQKGFDVASSLLGGASSVGSKWMSFSRAGVPGFGGGTGGGTPVIG
jgi:hypothetical protein